MSITKRAFVQGLQRSLVTSGAIPPYSSKWQAKHALDQAEEKLEEKTDKEPEEMSEEEISETMTDIVEAEPLDEAIEALQEYQEAAGDTEDASEQLAEALEDVKSSKEAAIAIRRLKMANAVGSGPVGNEMIGRGVGDLESGLGHAPQMPANLKVDMLEPHAHVGPNHGDSANVLGQNIKDRTSGKGTTKEEVKTALAILRKLAGENAAPSPASQNLGDLEEDPRPEHYATVNPVHDVQPHEPKTTILDHHSVAGTGRETLAHLVQKTAQEVGHFLPQELSNSDKLAALRTMVGMTGQEIAAYIGRIKEAMYSQDPETQAANALRSMGL